MIVIREYRTQQDKSPFADWFDQLEARAAQKVAIALARIEHGNFSNSTMAQATGSILVKTVKNWLSFWEAETRNGNSKTSKTRKPLGGITNPARNRRNDNGPHK